MMRIGHAVSIYLYSGKKEFVIKIHYFQRYHEKENVAMANTMLLLLYLYSYSSDKFFRFLKSEFFTGLFESELVFRLQEKSVDSIIPDPTITQEVSAIYSYSQRFWFQI